MNYQDAKKKFESIPKENREERMEALGLLIEVSRTWEQTMEVSNILAEMSEQKPRLL